MCPIDIRENIFDPEAGSVTLRSTFVWICNIDGKSRDANSIHNLKQWPGILSL